MENWMVVITILGSMGAGFVYFMNRMDRGFERIDARFERLENKIETGFKEVRKDVAHLDSRVSRIEGQLTIHDDLKEN